MKTTIEIFATEDDARVRAINLQDNGHTVEVTATSRDKVKVVDKTSGGGVSPTYVNVSGWQVIYPKP